jgi:hypothetical protein
MHNFLPLKAKPFQPPDGQRSAHRRNPAARSHRVRWNDATHLRRLGALLVFVAANVGAVEFGAQEVHSKLGEPLDVTVELLRTNGRPLDLRVGSPGAYRLAALDRPDVLETATLTLNKQAGDRVLVSIRTVVPVKQTPIDLLLELHEHRSIRVIEHEIDLPSSVTAAPQAGSAVASILPQEFAEGEARATQPVPAQSAQKAKLAPPSTNAVLDTASVAGPVPGAISIFGALAEAEKEGAIAAISSWAQAWQGKNLNDYLAAYAPDYMLPAGQTRAAWEARRIERIQRASGLSIEISGIEIIPTGRTLIARFEQRYRASGVQSVALKELMLVKVGTHYKIRGERVLEERKIVAVAKQ